MPSENWNNAQGRRDAQFENYGVMGLTLIYQCQSSKNVFKLNDIMFFTYGLKS